MLFEMYCNLFKATKTSSKASPLKRCHGDAPQCSPCLLQVLVLLQILCAALLFLWLLREIPAAPVPEVSVQRVHWLRHRSEWEEWLQHRGGLPKDTVNQAGRFPWSICFLWFFCFLWFLYFLLRGLVLTLCFSNQYISIPFTNQTMMNQLA